MPLREPLAEFDIDPAPIWPAEDARLEPAFPAGLLWIEFAEADRLNPEPAHPSLETALLVGFEEPNPVEFERAQLRAEEPPPTPSRGAVTIGMAGSVGVHLLPLLFLLGWSGAPSELAAAMPIQLVLEQPPPEPPKPEPPKPLAARPASDDIGDTAKATPAPPRVPPPGPPPQLQPGRPAQRLAAVAPPPPKATRPAKPAVAAPFIPSPPPTTSESPRAERIPGPEASRDEYLAYLVTLTRRHVDLLPLSVIAGRRGETSLSLLVLGDGTIARISIVQGSGYNDIDAKIEQIVAAVRRFPPLPQRFSGPNLELTLRFRFPDAVLGR